MIDDLKPYPEYKESGSPWLANVPSHWEVRALRTLIRARNERNRADLPLLSVARERGVFVRSLTDVDENHNVIPEDLANYKVARIGNLVINKMKAWQGSMGIAPCDGIVSPAYFVFDFRIANCTFGQVLLRSKSYVAHFGQASDGVRVGQWDLTISGMRQIPVLVPPPSEQAAIVRFLDWANGRLERAIRAKRKVIALLNEQKQAIIQHAVTRGLDPSVPLKPSGVPWLGDIPQHWETRRVKSLSPVKRGASPRPIADMRYFSENGEYAWVRIKDVSASNRYLETTTERLSELGKSRSIQIEPYSIFLSIAGSVGKPIISKIKCCIHDGFVYFPQFKGNTEFLFYVFSSGRVYDGLGKLGTQLNLNTETVGSIRVPWPEMHEQGHIVTFLDQELQMFEVVISRLEREITLLREYRTRLVADVVTGKLDVREAAARLPDEVAPVPAEEDGDLDEETEEVSDLEGAEEDVA